MATDRPTLRISLGIVRGFFIFVRAVRKRKHSVINLAISARCMPQAPEAALALASAGAFSFPKLSLYCNRWSG